MVIKGTFDLFLELLKVFKYGQEQKEFGNPGTVVTRRTLIVYNGVNAEDLEKYITQIDDWSDMHRLPSLSHLFRVPVDMGGKLVIDDVITWLLCNHRDELAGLTSPRRELELLDKGDQNYCVIHRTDPNWGHNREISFNLDLILKNKNVLERDIAQNMFWNSLQLFAGT